MKCSQLLGKRYKEVPSDTKLKSHELLIRGGYIRPVFSGVFSCLLPARKVLQKIEEIIREEMNAIGGQEVEMPLVQPKELWEESGRYQGIERELVRLKDRNAHDMVLAMTHEEAAVALARTEATTYKDYPFMIYQFAKKFRDEARPRGGLIRVREFTMKDAYSFHRTVEDLENYYGQCARAYGRIYARVGVPEVLAIQGDNGIMGGKVSHEYMLLSPCGEDTIIICPHCGYQANKEVASSDCIPKHDRENEMPLEKVHTPGVKTIQEVARFLNVPMTQVAKTVLYRSVGEEKLVVVMIRGDLEVNESKLAKVLKAIPEFAGDAEITAAGSVPGFSSAYGLDNVRIIADKSLEKEKNLVTGANEQDYHLKNFNFSREMPGTIFQDIANVQEGDLCPVCHQPLTLNRGIEVGNIFQLGDKYTRPMQMRYMDEQNQEQTPIMGCYGIGIGRLMASVIEAKHDDKGPIWPVSIAPWPVSIITLCPKNGGDEVNKCSGELYQKLQENHVDVLWDDRVATPGEKFADNDLLGIPLQLVLSERNLEKGQVEWKERGTGQKGFVPVDQVIPFVQNWLEAENTKLLKGAETVKVPPKEEYTH